MTFEHINPPLCHHPVVHIQAATPTDVRCSTCGIPMVRAASGRFVATHDIEDASLDGSSGPHQRTQASAWLDQLAVMLSIPMKPREAIIQQVQARCDALYAIQRTIGKVGAHPISVAAAVAKVWGEAIQYGEYRTQAKAAFVQIRAVFDEPEATTFERIVGLVQNLKKGWVDVNASRDAIRVERDAIRAADNAKAKLMCDLFFAISGKSGDGRAVGEQLRDVVSELMAERDKLAAERDDLTADTARQATALVTWMGRVATCAGLPHGKGEGWDRVLAEVLALKAERDDLKERHGNLTDNYNTVVREANAARIPSNATLHLDAATGNLWRLVGKDEAQAPAQRMTEADLLTAMTTPATSDPDWAIFHIIARALRLAGVVAP